MVNHLLKADEQQVLGEKGRRIVAGWAVPHDDLGALHVEEAFTKGFLVVLHVPRNVRCVANTVPYETQTRIPGIREFATTCPSSARPS